MVTDEERDYMYRVYAAEQRMRINGHPQAPGAAPWKPPAAHRANGRPPLRPAGHARPLLRR
jgi:hypothetical protein